MEVPVIFLAFANNDESHLPSLTEEEEIIYRNLLPGESKSYYKIHKDSFASPESICRYLIEFENRVTIFHYGGHAESDSLILSGGEADAQGIAQLLANQTNLKLVFLNGCSTQEQVRLLLEQGTPIVIATSSPINDNQALKFAEYFYTALAKEGNSIEKAFNYTAGLLNTDKNRTVKVSIYRSASFNTPVKKEEFPWGLYTSSDQSLEWQLPNEITSKKEVTISTTSDRYTFSKAPVNKTLFEVLLNTIRPYDEDLDYFLRKKEKDKPVDEREFWNAIINYLPAPIGIQVRRLFAIDQESYDKDKIGVPRLEQLVRTYRSLTEFFAFILLSNLWDIKDKFDKEIPAEIKKLIQHVFTLKEQEISIFDHTPLIQSTLKFFEESQLYAPQQLKDDEQSELPVFLEELKDVYQAYQEEDGLPKTIKFLEMIKGMVVNQEKLSVEELESACVQGEEELANLFKNFGFGGKYKLTTIKSISIRKPRNKPALYRHKQVKLYGITMGYLDVFREQGGGFTDNHSVILLKEEEKLDEYLNLSPFIIDINALKGEDKSQLFFYHFYDREKNEIHYKGAGEQDDTLVLTPEELEKEPFKEIRDQFDQFSESIFGKPLKSLSV